MIALDSRGHGLSDKPHDASAYGPDMAGDVIALMDELKITRAHIVGYSMGTEVAAMLLLRAPERVRNVVLIAGAGRFRWLPTDDQHMEEEALEYENFWRESQAVPRTDARRHAGSDDRGTREAAAPLPWPIRRVM